MKRTLLKPVSGIVLLSLLLELFYPTYVLASGGPSQPEVQGFKEIGVSEFVNPSTGDFSYNIPLLDVGGYPLNMSYASGGSMDQEASWVGFGWSFNPGVMNRTVRGLPDDFKGDDIERKFWMKPQATYGVGIDLGFELIGLDTKAIGLSLSTGIGINYNTYNGYGFELNVNPSIGTAGPGKSKFNVGLGLSASSNSGVSLQPSVSFSATKEVKGKPNTNLGLSIGTAMNSRSGLQGVNVGASVSTSKQESVNKTDKKGNTYKADNSTSSTIGRTSANYSFVNPTYTPSSEFPTFNTALSFRGTFGGAIFGTHPDVTLRGYLSRQDLLKTSKTDYGYGYLYEDQASESSLRDFNREKDGSFSDVRPNLPLANHTYDIFSASGQGVSGSFRPFRNDVGVLHDPTNSSIGGGDASGSIEIGVGNLAHYGGEFNIAINTLYEGAWSDDNTFKNLVGFNAKPSLSTAESSNNVLVAARLGSVTPTIQEHVYFKQAGELNVDPEHEIYDNWGGDEAVRIQLNKNVMGAAAMGQLEYQNGASVGFSSAKVSRKGRLARNQVLEYIDTREYKLGAGYEKQIQDYKENNFVFSLSGYQNGAVNHSYRKNHHLGQMSVVRPDGVRYIYGIPAYNTKKQEITFAINPNQSKDCGTGLVGYGSSDLGPKNNNGSDEYYDETITPPFAHSYLLSGVISQDYVDLTNNGMSPDDLGSYTKFNYTLSEPNFGWRNPIDKDSASYNEGLKSLAVDKESDDKGSIIYGEKELWYAHSIETKTHIAEFHTSPRLDAYGIAGINGGFDENSPMKKLDKIVLYTREEKLKEATTLGYVAIPIKTVHFEYDYSICPGYPNNLGLGQNNAGGKLTLRKVFFTYGNSNKGVLNTYEFTYGENRGLLNPSYNLKAYDRWGNYSPNFTASCDNGNTPTKPEYPYVVQNKLEQDNYAAAWHMTAVKLPSGGKIQVDYESDDYAYVQDRKAMQMFMVEGVSNSPTAAMSSTLYSGSTGNNFLIFKLQNPLETANHSHIRNFYLKDITQLYFRFFLNLGAGAREYVPGYAEVENAECGVYTPLQNSEGKYTHGFVRLRGVGVKHSDDGGAMNPISKAGWQYMRLNLPRKAYGQNSPNEEGFIQILKAMGSTFSQIEQYIQGFNNDLKGKGYSQTFVVGKSWVRLHNSNGHKLGGGSRVKKVVISDEWQEMGGGYTRTYGQEYNYETTEDINGQTVTISSGVASYEPIAGGDENPFRRPIFTSQKAYLAPGIDSYQEEPFGEDFMPSPGVVYSKVTVKNIQNENIKRNATGRVEHEFFTAKDFPTKIYRTSPNVARSGNKDNVSNFLKISVQDYATVSQGYSIVLNDMHGKQKAQRVYPEDSNVPISWVEYHYALDNKNDIENTRQVMYKYNSNGLIQNAEIGVEIDVAVDMRESRNKTTSGGANFNTDGFLAAIFPIVLPTIFPNFAQEETQFRSATVTKVINKAGILEETVAFDLGSQVSTTNELYDAITGEVLLTKTVNQFNDEIYNFTYPAHWAYNEMGSAYENVGFREKNKTLTALNSKYFNEGDELLLRKGAVTNRVWVTSTIGGLSVKDIGGSSSYSDEYNDIILIRSGKRNMQATPIGTVTTLENPVKTVSGTAFLSFDKVINAQATEFTDEWSVFCNCGVDPNGIAYNPYKEGARGIWRPNRAFVYLTEREQTNLNGNINIRQDGIFKTFKPFWQPPTRAGMSWYADETNWQYTTDITEFSTYGFELENQDALGRYSASVYGYSNTLPMGVANNSEYREIAFDSFEDYRTTDNCLEDHFSFREHKANVVEEEAHSGRHSIKVSAGSTSQISVTKLIEVCDEE